MSIAGIDIGSTGSKCCAYSEDGRLLAEYYVEYAGRLSSGTFEIDAQQIWESVKCAVKKVTETVPDIRAVGLTSFGESFVLLDEREQVLFPMMIYVDNRGEEESLELQRRFGAKAFGKIAGVKPSLMMSAPKIMWVRKHHAEIFTKTKHVLLGADYIVFCLCGAFVTDYTLASRTAMFDVRSLDWNEEILEFVGIRKEQLPRALPTGSVAGTVQKEVALELGLPEDAQILAGCHDQIASAVGTGILKPGMAVDSLGSVECITSFYESCPEYLSLYKGGYAIVPYVLPDTYVTYAFSFTGGAMLRWYRDELGKFENELARKEGKSFYQYMDECMEDRPTNLLVLPHFAGAATPYMDSESRGAIVGMTTETTMVEIYRAFMEGSTYEMRYNLDKLAEGGIRVKELRATGGGSQSAQWLQIKADILNVPLMSQGNYKAGGLGCVMLAGIAAGCYRNLEEAAQVFVKPGQIYYPRKEMYEQYSAIYERYRNLYQAIKMVL